MRVRDSEVVLSKRTMEGAELGEAEEKKIALVEAKVGKVK